MRLPMTRVRIADEDFVPSASQRKPAIQNQSQQVQQGAGINQTSTTSPKPNFKTTSVVDRYGRTVEVFTEGPMAGTIVGTDRVLFEPAPEPYVETTPNVGTPRQPKGVAGATWIKKPDDSFELQVDEMPAAEWNKKAIAANEEAKLANFDQNAFDVVKGKLKQFGIEGLESVVRGWILNKVSEDAAIANLRDTDEYKARFQGNVLRQAAKLNVIDEATYLAQENDYEEWARYYGVLGKIGPTPEKRREAYATFMANSVFTPEYKDRLSTYVDRVDMGDPGIKRTLRSFYNITDDDLLGYFINPKENIKVLQEKVTASEIGTAATAQGLRSGRTRAEELARFGIDRAAAIAGYQNIAGALPRGQMLGGIYREEGIDYTQETAEEEEFKQMQSAQRARRRLAEREAATFGGASAIARGSLASGTAGAI